MALRRLAAAAFLCLVACGSPGSETEHSPTPASTSASNEASPPTGSGSASGRGSAEPLVASLRAVGPGGAVPERLVIRFNQPVFAEDKVGAKLPADQAAALHFTPPVEGTLKVEDRAGLVFVPKTGFRPDTDYTVVLDRLPLQDRSAPAQAEGGAASWKTSFHTAKFAFRRAWVSAGGQKGGRATVELSFSAAVEPAAVGRRLTVTVGGAVLRPTEVTRGDSAGDVRVSLVDPRLQPGATVNLSLARGLPYAGDPKVVAPAAQMSLSLANGPEIEIQAVLAREGVDGYYLEVVCTDHAVSGRRWWWDSQSYENWKVSDRCLLTDDSAQDSIRLQSDGVLPKTLSVGEGPAGFRIFGPFPRGRLHLRIEAGATSIDGGTLARSFSTDLDIPARSPRVSFAAVGRYLPKSAWTNLGIKHLNLDKVQLIVRHVPPENVVFWLGGSEWATARTSDVVLKKEIPLQNPPDQEVLSWIDVGALLPDAGSGVYELLLEGEGDTKAAARLVRTDLQLVAKKWTPGALPADGQEADDTGSSGAAEEDQAKAPGDVTVMAWALDTHTNFGVPGVALELVKPSGRVVARCRTGSDGGCTLFAPADPIDDTEPFALIARKGDDLTFLKFADLAEPTADDTTGLPYEGEGAKAAYSGAAWTDRGVYRPGETAHLVALVRGADHQAPDAGLPVVLRVIDPRGKALRKVVLSTDGTGLVTHDLALADFATTGRYRAEFDVAERRVAEVEFNVEEFVPERMHVEASVGTGQAVPELSLRDPVPISVAARWLFGGSAKGHRVAVKCRARQAEFHPPHNADYHYGPAAEGAPKPRPVDLGTQTALLDEAGKAMLYCPPAGSGAAVRGAAEVVADVDVFESNVGGTGQSTHARAVAPVHPAPFYLGLQAQSAEARVGQSLVVRGIVVDHQGERIATGPSQVDVEIYRLQRVYSWMWENEGSSYRQELRRVREKKTQVPVANGRFTVQFTPRTGAEGYVVSVSAGGALSELFVEGAGRRWWWWDAPSAQADRTPRPGKPSHLELSVPELVRMGETVEVTTRAPYAGRMLFTVETDHVLETAWRSVDGGEVKWSFPVRAFAPNLYVTALLLKDPHQESAKAYLPERAWGVASIRVEPVAYSQQVTLDVPDEIRPWSPLEVKLRVSPATSPVKATIAAVDEGVLSLTDFQSPDPLAQIFAKRALGVGTFETVGWTLLSQPAGPSSHTGGGAPGAGIGRVHMVKPVALWSGVIDVPPTGVATVKLDVPGYRGKLRVMAVTASRGRMGHASAEVVVKDPLVLQTTLPRFLVAGDEAHVPVFVSNTTAETRQVGISLVASALRTAPGAGRTKGGAGKDTASPVKVVGSANTKLRLAPGASGTAVFALRALGGPGAAHLVVTASSAASPGSKVGELQSKDELDLPVVVAQPMVREVKRVPLHAGRNDLSALVDGWVPGTDRTTVWVTTNPYGQALGRLRALLHYPYGCIEQTTSTTRPWLVLSRLMGYIDPEWGEQGARDVDEAVNYGIERVFSMQTPSGGFAYWPSGDRPKAWETAYASDMLLDAKRAGYTVPEQPFAEALDWLGRWASARTGGGMDIGGLQALAYAHYVLARAGRAQPARVRQLLESVRGAEATARWAADRLAEARLLAEAALWLSGDRTDEADLKRLDTSPIRFEHENDWTFYSDLRRRAMALVVYSELFGSRGTSDAAAARAADQIAAALTRFDERRYTTQELAFGLVALGRREQAMSGDLPKPSLWVGGGEVAVRDSDSRRSDWSWLVPGVTGAGRLVLELSKAPSEAWAVVTTEGVRKVDDRPVGDHGLALTRELLDAQGRPVEPTACKIGDLFYIRDTIRNSTGRRQQNIALLDRLPAGFEIENPRLRRGGDLPEWVDDGKRWQLDHMDVRDDRLEGFGALEAGESAQIVYAVRAVISGEFSWPEIRAEAMYDPDVRGRETGGRVIVSAPWDSVL